MSLSEILSNDQCRQITEWVLEKFLHGNAVWSVRGDGSLHDNLNLPCLDEFKKAAKEFKRECLSRKEVAALINNQQKTEVRPFLIKHFTETMAARMKDQDVRFFADVKETS